MFTAVARYVNCIIAFSTVIALYEYLAAATAGVTLSEPLLLPNVRCSTAVAVLMRALTDTRTTLNNHFYSLM